MTYADFGDGVGYVYVCELATPNTILQVHKNVLNIKDFSFVYNRQIRDKIIWLDNRVTANPNTIAVGSLDITQDIINEQSETLLTATNGSNIRQITIPVKFDGAARSIKPNAQFNGSIIAVETFVTTDIDPANDGKIDVAIAGVSCLTGNITIPMGSVASPVAVDVDGVIDTLNNTFLAGDLIGITTDTATSGEVLVIITMRCSG